MKRLVALLLAVLMCAAMLVGCGGNSSTSSESTSKATEGTKEAGENDETKDAAWPEETYHAVMVVWVANDNWPNMDGVVKKVAEITKRDLNIEVEMLPMTMSTSNTQVPLMLSGGQQIDVFANFTDPVTQYEEGKIIAMEDYWDYLHEVIYDVFGEDEVLASYREGHLLGFSPRLERTHRYGMAMRTDILNEVGYTADDLKECGFDQATEIFKAVHDKYPDMVVMGGPYNSGPATNFQHTDTLTDNYGVLDNYAQTFEVTNAYEGEYYIKAATYMKQWYDAGYIQKDLATSQDSYESLVKAGNTFGGCCPMKPDSYAEKQDQCAHDMTIFYWAYDMVNAYSGSGYAIGGTSKDPAKAAVLMNYIFTSREFNDMVNWGVEGIDWVESDDPSHNVATFPEGMTAETQTYHNSYGWAYPNQRIAHVWDNNEPNMYTEIYPNAEINAYHSKAYGFQFDNSEWVDAEGAFTNIMNEYLYVIASGAVSDPEAKIKEYNDKLYASGLEDYMKAQQEQLDAWCAENGISE